MPTVFISYRQKDTLPITGRIADRLIAAYGRGSVYRDIDTTPPGIDIRQHIGEAVGKCDVLIVLIGPQWLELDQNRQSRLENPADLVRIEIEAAISHQLALLPVLVDGAAMPRETDLPLTIKDLAYRHAVKMDPGADFHHHMTRLLEALDIMCPPGASELRRDGSAATPAESSPRRTRPLFVGKAAPRFSGKHGSLQPDRFERKPLSIQRGIVLTALAVILNGVLAALGSVLWEHFPYWPSFMVFALICAYYGFWGVLVAILSPIAATLLLTGGASVYLYVLVNLLQAVLVLAAFRSFQIDPRLTTWRDVAKYLCIAVAVPSLVGGCSAWLLRGYAEPTSNDPSLATYAGWWSAENLLPAVFPGIWLHRVLGQFYKPFSWEIGGRPRSWMVRTMEYATPWMITLLIAGSLVVFMVLGQIGTVTLRPAIWKRVHELAAESAPFRFMVLAMSVSVLVSLGYAIRHAKQTWILEEAVRRHLPTQQEAERILSGRMAPSERRVATLVCASLPTFRTQLGQFRPAEVVTWLNAFFEQVTVASGQNNGCIDRYTTDGMLLIFGLNGGDGHAIDAIRFAVDLTEQVEELNRALEAKHLPPVSVSVGIHTGLIIAGELGSRDRRQYAILGEAVYIVKDIEGKAESLVGRLPILISLNSAREAGLLLDSRFNDGFISIAAGDLHEEQVVLVYAVRNRELAWSMIRETALDAPSGRPEDIGNER